MTDLTLNLAGLLDCPGRKLDFSFQLDLSDMDFPFGKPCPEPITVTGLVENRAGALSLAAEMRGTLSLTCDRCAEPYTAEKTVSVFYLLVDRADDTIKEDDLPDEMLAVKNGQLDVSEPLTAQWVLDLDMKHLCSEDCPGLCPRCGRKLSDGTCSCNNRQVDPRLQKLSEFFSQ